MLSHVGSFFADQFRKWIPDSFVFALVLTVLAGVLSMVFLDTALFDVLLSHGTKVFGRY